MKIYIIAYFVLFVNVRLFSQSNREVINIVLYKDIFQLVDLASPCEIGQNDTIEMLGKKYQINKEGYFYFDGSIISNSENQKIIIAEFKNKIYHFIVSKPKFSLNIKCSLPNIAGDRIECIDTVEVEPFVKLSKTASNENMLIIKNSNRFKIIGMDGYFCFPEKGKMKIFRSEGNSFTLKDRELFFRYYKSGSFVYFKKITIKSESGNIYYIKNYNFQFLMNLKQ